MQIECDFLGTGTSYGVPAIGCGCPVCTSSNSKNKRLRSSVYLRVTPEGQEARFFLIDVTPDFRTQALRAKIAKLDAVLFTHEHADHTQGIDDLRALYWLRNRKDIPIYAYPECMAALHKRFAYMFDHEHEYKGAAKLQGETFEYQPFEASGIPVHPIPLVHGPMRVAAFRIGDFAYLTDTNYIPDASIEALRGVKLLVIDALRRTPHPTHMSLPEALRYAERIGPEKVFFTHINHDMEHEEIEASLSDGAHLAYDQLRVRLTFDKKVEILS